jgi:hypothetical protein
MRELAPWLTILGLGMYHGVNPAMGWLFAVALGLHRGRRSVVAQSLIPIGIGHLLAVAVVAEAVLALGVMIDRRALLMTAGGLLVIWAVYHGAYGSRHPARIGMRAGFAGLLRWSFLMAGAHGAGLMLVPALVPLCTRMDQPGLALDWSARRHRIVSARALSAALRDGRPRGSRWRQLRIKPASSGVVSPLSI